MRILIRELHAAADQTVALGRLVDTGLLRIGRGSDQDIELNDLQLGLAHAELSRVANGYLLRARGRPELRVNERMVAEALLGPGDVVDCGRYRLTLGSGTSDAELTIDIEERLSAKSARSERLDALRARLTPQMPMRTIGWSAFLLVLVACLLSPLLLRYALHTSPHTKLPVPTDAAWMPSPLTPAHAFLGKDCGACHRQAFIKVNDETCRQCHVQTAADHMRNAHHDLPAATGLACSDCHRMHESPQQAAVHDNSVCMSCHGSATAAATGSPAAPSFTSQHPAFRPQVARFDDRTASFDWIEVSQNDAQALHDDNSLKFPHDLHLASAGIRSPDGMRRLECSNCHEPDEQGRAFKPVSMEKHCSQCHRLDFDPDFPDRTLTHGASEQVVAEIRGFYAHEALSGDRRNAGAPRPTRAWADQRATQVIDEVFTQRTCKVCHAVEPTGDIAMPWRVAPVTPPAGKRLAHATAFDHTAHRGESCESCHAASQSHTSNELMLPSLSRCQTCHGDPGSGAIIQSTCLDCHRYHPGGGDDPLAQRTRKLLTAREAQQP
ncbi:hypothetical protein [Solimonas terrae]|uniref:Uncharacterized protein n=1 Tax=Solimonas terrae TaxID=1396819 RepID=A0A6M2BVR2_9GAMM|nr:hypothetical protein [Solimonas terrae]NGY06047.1 hypothetical protein [Solimonas terrae]